MCGYNGTGVIVETQDPSPPGVSLSAGSETFLQPCECVDQGVCPWCGSPLTPEQANVSFTLSELECTDPACEWTWKLASNLASEPPDWPEP